MMIGYIFLRHPLVRMTYMLAVSWRMTLPMVMTWLILEQSRAPVLYPTSLCASPPAPAAGQTAPPGR